jgi:uncharacterized membrane protein HdeD (DUF308 family)
MLKSLSTYLIVRGVLALIVGIVAVAWPGVTVYALVVLFAVYAFMDAVVQAVRAFSEVRARAVTGRILIALVDVAAGVVAIAYPNITAVALVVIVAIWAIAFGVLELFAASGAGETAGTRAWLVVAGLVSIAFGFVLVGRPDVGAVSLAVIYGIFSTCCAFRRPEWWSSRRVSPANWPSRSLVRLPPGSSAAGRPFGSPGNSKPVGATDRAGRKVVTWQ